MKLETIEEFAERIAHNFEEPSFKAGVVYGIIEGAKWQAERMYSEEEVHQIIDSNDSQDWSSENDLDYWEWFEQFEKK